MFEGGPAREAGIRPGDQVLKVDEVPAPAAQTQRGHRPHPWRGGDHVTLTVRRRRTGVGAG
ncbi:MAG: PDZ domain-containing protein [Deltaproteobacteria bacterium]|nr:PDZ domain-containing protein [Deltaproteobacteria bacterium]